MARIDELRLMAKVARLYYEAGQKQPEIAERLSLSPGRRADLLVVRGNPLESLRALLDVAAVYQDGRRVAPATQALSK